MNTVTIDRLLCLLDVQMHALALCEVSHGTGLRLPGMEAVLVHYILEGSGVLILEDGTTVAFGPDTLIFLPPGASHDMAETRETPSLITWKDVATPLGDGMMRFATEGPSTAILSACGTISADCGGLDLFALTVAVASFVALQRLKVPVYLLVPVGAVLGMVWTLL